MEELRKDAKSINERLNSRLSEILAEDELYLTCEIDELKLAIIRVVSEELAKLWSRG